MAETATGTGPANDSGGGSVATTHPQYDERVPEWELMRTTEEGETAVKDAGRILLPMPQGFAKQKDKGESMYAAYKERAQFPEIVSPTIMGMLGVIHRMDAQIEMPDAMQPLWESATKDGLPLEALHRRITYEVLTTGRYGLLAEAASANQGGSDIPWIATYTAENIINWSEDKDFFVLDEASLKRDGFAWIDDKQWRVLQLDNNVYTQTVYSGDSQTVQEPIVPQARGGKPMDTIPFVIIGPRDLETDTVKPPLIGVARAAKSIYQLSADYRHQLYMTGQETLFVFNMDPPDAVGAGVVVHVKDVSKEQHAPDARYISPTCAGIDAHKVAMADEYAAASRAGARLFDAQDSGGSAESGESRRMRYAAQTSTLTSISQTVAQGLEKALKNIAVMMGLNPDDVTVKPNLTFIDTKMSADDATKLVKVWQDGAISYETLYDNLQKGEIASSERTFEEEQELIAEEDAQSQATAAENGLIPMLPGQQPNTQQVQQQQTQQVPPSNAPAPVPPAPAAA